MTPPVLPPRQRGAALLTAMIIVTIVATLAAGMVWQQWHSIEVEAAERERSQSHWILSGALDWARLILREAANSKPGEVSPFVRAGASPVEWFRALIDAGISSGELKPLIEPYRFMSLMGAITVFHFAAMPWLTPGVPFDPWSPAELEKHTREILAVARTMLGIEGRPRARRA